MKIIALVPFLLAAFFTSFADAQLIAFDDFDSDSNLTGFVNNIPGGVFTDPGDGFNEFQRGVSGIFRSTCRTTLWRPAA